MKFLNGKEEVIDIEITSYGRYLISKGKFKPHFYSFFDDGILYDNQYGGISEPQNSIQNRIKNDTPRLQAQANYAGVETKLKNNLNNYEVTQKENFIQRQSNTPGDPIGFYYYYDVYTPKEGAFEPPVQADADKFYSLKYPIGSSDLNTDKAPSWNIKTLQGLIANSTNNLTGAFVSERIPQLNLTSINYETLVGKIPPNTSTAKYDYVFVDDQGNPANFINILPGEDEIILDISENNTFFGEQNFDIEVYTVEDETFNGKIKQHMVPLYFVKQQKLVEDGILKTEGSNESVFKNAGGGTILETEGDLNQLRGLDLDPTYVDYYFSIEVDDEIDEEILCKLTVDKSEGIFSERYLNCESTEKKKSFDNSRVFDGDTTINKIGDCE